MITATVYTCADPNKDQDYSPDLEAMLKLLESEGLGKYIICDVKEVMMLTRGKCNPNGGFVFVMYDETLITDIYALCRWIESKGLRRC